VRYDHYEVVSFLLSELRRVLMERETELAKLKSELQDLHQYKALQKQQETEIARLEKQLEKQKFEHENILRSRRAHFLRQRQALEDDYEARRKAMSTAANREAAETLKKQSDRIKSENKELRQELGQLIQTTQDLQTQKVTLQRQMQALLREQQVQDDLGRLKRKRAGLIS
jgi:chromosome segregation ATPase